jgi:DNA repair protein RadC
LRKTVESIGASLGKSDERSCLPRGKPDLETQLFAGAEFWRRRYRPATHRVKSARDLLPLLAPYKANSQEYFLGFYLNGAHELISQKVITIGLANSALVHPREVFSIAIRENACALVVAHNHPSGDLTPSEQDIEVTIRLSRAGDLMGIKLLDHIIVSKRGYFSFEEQGKLDDLKRSESSIRW